MDPGLVPHFRPIYVPVHTVAHEQIDTAVRSNADNAVHTEADNTSHIGVGIVVCTGADTMTRVVVRTTAHTRACTREHMHHGPPLKKR